ILTCPESDLQMRYRVCLREVAGWFKSENRKSRYIRQGQSPHSLRLREGRMIDGMNHARFLTVLAAGLFWGTAAVVVAESPGPVPPNPSLPGRVDRNSPIPPPRPIARTAQATPSRTSLPDPLLRQDQSRG